MINTPEKIAEHATIAVQLIHIDGPFKGKINEFTQDIITIGRDPENDVVYPADMRSISRFHAELIREGDQYLFVSLGKNSCLMNQTALDRSYIKPGDMIWLTQEGPKISFLAAAPKTPTVKPAPKPETDDQAIKTALKNFEQQKNEKAEFTFQYGTTIKSMQKGVVRLGTSEECDFCIQHPCVAPIQAEIIFRNKAFYIRDISNRGTTLVNGDSVFPEIMLQGNDIITFGKDGAQMRYLGTGRFSEVPQQEKKFDKRILDMLSDDEKEMQAVKLFLEPAPQKKGVSFIKSLLNRLWP